MQSDYRVVGQSTRHFSTAEYAVDFAKMFGGRVECYVYGIGWVRWCEAMQ